MRLTHEILATDITASVRKEIDRGICNVAHRADSAKRL